MEKASLVPVCRVGRAHGVSGAVKIYPYGETLADLEIGEKLYTADARGEAGRELTITGLRVQKKGLIGSFKEITSIDQVQELVGKELFIPEDRLPALEEGEYYQYQLLGLAVETRDGRHLGTLRSIMETGSNDVYVVEDGGKEILVPAIEDVICEIDIEAGKIIVDLPEGLE